MLLLAMKQHIPILMLETLTEERNLYLNSLKNIFRLMTTQGYLMCQVLGNWTYLNIERKGDVPWMLCLKINVLATNEIEQIKMSHYLRLLVARI